MMKVRAGYISLGRAAQRLFADQTVISDFSDGAMRPTYTTGLFPQEFVQI